MLRMRMRGEGDLGCCVAAFAEALTNVHTRQAGREAGKAHDRSNSSSCHGRLGHLPWSAS